MLTTLTQILKDHPGPREALLREELSGNLCRCTGYAGIVQAALQVAREAAAPVVREATAGGKR